jgi:hypothetical protein
VDCGVCVYSVEGSVSIHIELREVFIGLMGY